jgi:hypothetical protein
MAKHRQNQVGYDIPNLKDAQSLLAHKVIIDL